MVLFPVTLSDPNYLKSACHIFVVSEDRNFEFGLTVDGKPSLKGAWLGHVNHLNVGWNQAYLWNGCS